MMRLSAPVPPPPLSFALAVNHVLVLEHLTRSRFEPPLIYFSRIRRLPVLPERKEDDHRQCLLAVPSAILTPCYLR